MPLYYGTAVAGMSVSAVVLILPLADVRLPALGLSMAAVMWCSSSLAITRAEADAPAWARTCS